MSVEPTYHKDAGSPENIKFNSGSVFNWLCIASPINHHMVPITFTDVLFREKPSQVLISPFICLC